jgi:DNA-binding HxlR family transcriptional regulator
MSAFPIQIGGKWTAMVVLCLESGPRRFGVLRRHLQPISTKVLTETLRAMGRDGPVRRCPVSGADDGGVEYELTPLGRTLLDVIEHARDWARNHLSELVRARDGFDQAATPSATVTGGTRVG